jgi:signal recognition particle GTPase
MKQFDQMSKMMKMMQGPGGKQMMKMMGGMKGMIKVKLVHGFSLGGSSQPLLLNPKR